MTGWDAVVFAVNALVVLAMPVLIVMIRLTSSSRVRELQELQETFNIFENALITRIARLEERLDRSATQDTPPHA